MMKSFFKKLAFVMALAMVVSMAAPAGSALAAGLSVAYQAGGAVSELNVKAGAEQDLKFVGAPKNWKALGWSWTSSNEAVATVDAAGVVTAVADGTATITITVGDLTGSVVVNVGDAKAYDVTLGNADNKAMTSAELKKGATLDLNFYGVKDWNKNNYTVAWSVSGDAANVDKNGVVTAVKAGKAVVTASIVNNVTGVAHNVTPVEVAVAEDVNPDAFTVAQKDTDKFVLTFNEAKTVDAIKNGLTISVKIGEQDFPISFENVAVDGNKATVVTYAQFENDEVYTLAYANEKVEYTIVLGDIAEVGVKYYAGKNPENTTAYVKEEEEADDYVTLIPVLYDKYGNDITAKYNLDNFTFTYEVSGNVNPYCNYNDTYSFGAAGVATVKVDAAWVTDAGEFKEVSGSSYINVLKRGAVNMKLLKSGIAETDNTESRDDIKDVKKFNDTLFTYFVTPAESFQKDPNSALWNSASTSVMYKTAEDRELYFTAVFEDNRGNVVTTNSDYSYGVFTYESTNSDVLTVDDIDGRVDVREVGKTNILVYFEPADGTENKRLVASTAVTVTPETYPVSFKLESALATMASHVVDEDLNDATYKIKFFDQNGNPYRNDDLLNYLKLEARDNSVTFNLLDAESWNPGPKFAWEGWSQSYVFKLDASHYASEFELNKYNSKTYSFKLSLEDGDITDKVKTPYAVLNLVVKNTKEECDLLSAFIAATDNGKQDGIANAPAAMKSKLANYKFNLEIGGNVGKDIVVKNIQGYLDTGCATLVKKASWDTGFEVKYLSSGNLPVAKVPSFLIKDVNATSAKITTGHVGYVYYKVNAPAKTVAAGKSVPNAGFSYQTDGNKVDFAFNGFVDHPTKEVEREFFVLADGKEISHAVEGVDKVESWVTENNGWAPSDEIYSYDYWARIVDANGDPVSYSQIVVDGKYYIDGKPEVEVTFKKEVTPVQVFQYAANGNYTASFYNTRKEGLTLQSMATRTINVTNSQSEVKYLGLNPEFAGVSEIEMYASNLVQIVNEQLRFSYEDLFIGDYYGDKDAYGWNIALSEDQPKVKFDNGKSVNITDLYFDVTVDDGNNKWTYTSVVKVNARIKAK